MILGAGVLVLLGLGLFLAGIATDVTVLYWACVAACVAAGVLLVLARLELARTTPSRHAAPPAAAPAGAATATTTAVDTPTAQPTATGATAAPVAGHGATEPARPLRADAVPLEEQPAAPPVPGAQGEVVGDPPVEEVEVTDLLLVVDLDDEVLVVDEHPRYHVAGCPWLAGRTTVPLPVDEARTDGFTPCAKCAPDRNLAERERHRRAGRKS